MLGRSYRSAALSWSSSLLSNQPSSAITTSGTKNAIQLPITYLLPASHKKDSHESEFTDWNFEAKKYVFSPFSVLFSWFASAENHPKWRWERQNDHHRRSSYTIQTDEGPSGTLHFFLKCQNLDLCTYLSQASYSTESSKISGKNTGLLTTIQNQLHAVPKSVPEKLYSISFENPI